jgi:hypothetical protein
MTKAPQVAALLREGMANLERRAEAMLELGTAVNDRGHRLLDFCEADFNALAVEFADLEAALQREESNSAKGTPADRAAVDPVLELEMKDRLDKVEAAIGNGAFAPYDPVTGKVGP